MKESFEQPVEQEPALPEDPQEAAKYLHGLWEARGKWPKREDLGLEERESLEKVKDERREFEWLAQLFGSEMLWLQRKINTNHGTIHCFHFGYDTEDTPNAFIFNPGTPEEMVQKGTMVYEQGDVWKKEPLSATNAAWVENFV